MTETTCPTLSMRLRSMEARADLWSGKLDVPGLIRRAATVNGRQAVDLLHPRHFRGIATAELKAELEAARLPVKAINPKYGDEHAEFLLGGFTHPDRKTRRQALDYTLGCATLCRELGAGQLNIWPGNDGYDYAFQADYGIMWKDAVDAFREVCDAFPDLKVTIEYKPYEPRKFYLVPDGPTALLMVNDVSRENFGLCIDFCHSLFAGENPAHPVQMAASRGRLFALHMNDGYGRQDDGLVVGSVHTVETVEAFFYLQRHGFTGHLYFDTFPINEDPVREAEWNLTETRRLWDAASALAGDEALHAALEAQDALTARKIIRERLA